jgi:hypothetical protein
MKLPWREKTIDTVESKSVYLRHIEAFREAKVNKRCERDLHVRIK